MLFMPAMMEDFAAREYSESVSYDAEFLHTGVLEVCSFSSLASFPSFRFLIRDVCGGGVIALIATIGIKDGNLLGFSCETTYLFVAGRSGIWRDENAAYSGFGWFF